jgi:ComF family protein
MKLEYIGEPRCKKCSKPIEFEEQEYCSDCVKKQFHYKKGYSIWIYNDSMKKSIAYFKYHGRREYSVFYIQEMVKHYGEQIIRLAPDVIVPIPLHRSREAHRGYNQADILAKGIGRELHIPVASKLLVRNKKTVPQKQLSDKQRLQNLQRAFRYNNEVATKYKREIKRVVIVDDIYTTGSTIEACTNVLLEHGIKEVYFITLCIGKGF